MLPAVPATITRAAFIRPCATSTPAGGMTISLGKGKAEDSTAIRMTIPGYPIRNIVSMSQLMMLCITDLNLGRTAEAVLSNKRDEMGVAQSLLLDDPFASSHPPQLLPAPVPRIERKNHAAPLPQLADQWRGYLGARRGYQDRVVRSHWRPPYRAVPDQEG